MKLQRRCWCCERCRGEEEELEEEEEEVTASATTAEDDARLVVIIELSAQAPPSRHCCSSPRAASRPTRRIVLRTMETEKRGERNEFCFVLLFFRSFSFENFKFLKQK